MALRSNQNIFIAGQGQGPWGPYGLPPTTGPYNPNGPTSTGAPGLPGRAGGDEINALLDRLMKERSSATSGATQPTQSTGNRQGIINKLLGGDPAGYADMASMAGAFSQGKKADRVITGNYTQDYDQMMLDREKNQNDLYLRAQADRNANENNSLRNLAVTSYLRGGGADVSPKSITLNGQQRELPNFGFGPRPASTAQMEGAAALEPKLLDRLKPGGSFMPEFNYQVHPLESYTKPGLAENIGSYGATGLGILGGLSKTGLLNRFIGGAGGAGTSAAGLVPGFGVQGLGAAGLPGGAMYGASAPGIASGASGAGSTIAGILGKAAPWAAVGAGAYGLTKDRGAGYNAMNGATAGAGIGTMIMPGIGTAIGAGVGALGGLARGAFGVSEKEKAGRTTAQQGRQALAAMGTPEQIQEAEAAGFKNPQDALALIVTRDSIAKAGGNPEMADQLMQQLWQAEKEGPEAVQQVLASIMNLQGNSNMGQPGAPRTGGNIPRTLL